MSKEEEAGDIESVMDVKVTDVEAEADAIATTLSSSSSTTPVDAPSSTVEEEASNDDDDDKMKEETTEKTTTTATTAVPLLYQFDSIQAPHPLKDRTHTKHVISSILEKPAENSTTITQQQQRLPLANVHGEGPLILSDIPASCRHRTSNSNNRNGGEDDGVILGIDEAGRGSVLGPMVYGCAYWSKSDMDSIPKDFNDSKQLSEKTRDILLQKILDTPSIGFAVRFLQASEISRNMLRGRPYNLNAMSHNAAIDIIRKLLDAGVNVKECFIDTVGIAEHYQRRLEREFGPGIDFTVESKADANYAVCSAASVVAKVLRDAMLQNWTFSEASSSATSSTNAAASADAAALVPTDTAFGSGYPSDPMCKAWMKNSLGVCPVFGFPDIVRFSWKPAKDALENAAAAAAATTNSKTTKTGGSKPVVAKVTFQADLDEADDAENDEFKLSGIKRQQQEQMTSFLGKKDGTSAKKKRYPYFQKRRLQVVTKL